jgi:hypothetical protein
VDHGHLLPQLAAEPCRHPGGVEAGDSVRAIANGDSCQDYLLARVCARLMP